MMYKNLFLFSFLIFSSCVSEEKLMETNIRPVSEQDFIIYRNNINNNLLNKNNEGVLYFLYEKKYIDQLNNSQDSIATRFYQDFIKSKYNCFIDDFFTPQAIRFALLEQIKYNIPASIKLAQYYLESKKNGKWELSNHIQYTNNYFGIKGDGLNKKTIEIFNKKQYLQYKSKILKVYNKKHKNNDIFYEVLIKDDFKMYNSKWESFRDHSIKLTQQNYYKLYLQNKNYKNWANLLGNKELGGLGYATSDKYGELLIKIIERYNLYLLDY